MTVREMVETYIKKMEELRELGDTILCMDEMEQEKFWEIESELQNMDEHLLISTEILETELM